ncbi:MAG: hypothetical protein ACRYGP_03610 [Janthinobacterium lividum]
MTLKIDVEEGQARWSEIIAEAEAGRDVVVEREAVPIAVVKGKSHRPSPEEVAEKIARIKEIRRRIAPTTIEEILAWRDEGRR